MDIDDIIVHGLLGRSRDEEEMAGAHEILGAEEILGALGLSSSALKASPEFKKALAAKLAKRVALTERKPVTKKRRYTLGFGPATVPPGTTVTVQTRPQQLFRGEKLINTGDVTGLYLTGIFVGNDAQTPTFNSAISVKTYEGGVLDNEQMFDTCQPAIDITMQVQNISTATATFSMSLVGHLVQ